MKLRRRRPPPCRCSAIAEQHRAALQLATEMASWPRPVELLRQAVELRPVGGPRGTADGESALSARGTPEATLPAPLVPPALHDRAEPTFHFEAGERQLLDAMARADPTERWTWPGP